MNNFLDIDQNPKLISDGDREHIYDEDNSDTPNLDTEVIVIGNGPAGISLSTFLSGWLPFYNSAHPHPDEIIHEFLSAGDENSIIDQDLSWFVDGCAERINPAVGPFACLYDTLVRPAPFGASDLQSAPSAVEWCFCPDKAVPHIVLGDSPIGGSWTTYDDEMVTVSLAHWMDLPVFSFSDWLSSRGLQGQAFANSRLPAKFIKDYMRAYVNCPKLCIAQNFQPLTRVSNIIKCCHQRSGEEYWEIHGEQLSTGIPFTLKCRRVVLACGKNHQRTLELSDEMEQNTQIVYDLPSLKRILTIGELQSQSEEAEGIVIVVGDGISAADAVLYCLDRRIPVLHIVRRNEKQLRNVTISRLAKGIYPEYNRIFELMLGQRQDSMYRCLTSARVLSLSGSEITIESTATGIIEKRFRCVAVCVGRRSELPIRGKYNEFLSNYKCSTDDRIFGIGSLAGDHFVRFLIGGALCVAQTLIRQNTDPVDIEQGVLNIATYDQIRPMQRPFRERNGSSEVEQIFGGKTNECTYHRGNSTNLLRRICNGDPEVDKSGIAPVAGSCQRQQKMTPYPHQDLPEITVTKCCLLEVLCKQFLRPTVNRPSL